MSNWFRQQDTIADTDIAKFLRERDNVDLIKLQDESTITALQSPITFIDNRQKAIEDIYKKDGVMATTYLKAFTRYKAMGLPASEAHDLANEASSATKVADFKALELKYPGGYEKAMQLAKTDHNSILATANTADSELVKQASKGNGHYEAKYRATKKKYKSTKKALKSKST